MDYKKKAKIEKIIYMFLYMAGFMAIGGFMGASVLTFEKHSGRRFSDVELILMFVIIMISIMLAYYINLCIHETGHMIFGLLTGYKFNSIRFGKIMFIKREGKIKLAMYDLPGTGGQCIMTAPDGDPENMPVVLYNLGGLFMNLFVTIAGVGVYLVCKYTSTVAGVIGLTFALTAFVLFMTNGVPLAHMGNDGANTIILHKNKNARKAFYCQLESLKYLSEGMSICEMPKEIVDFDSTISMDNPLITAQAVNYFSYLSGTKQYAKAKEMAEFILENAKSINTIHEKVLYGELIFLEAVINKNMNAAKEIFKANEKDIKSMAGLISIQRVLYAYYTLVEPDEKTAAKYAKNFERSVKQYPYPKDAEIEKEQFDMITAALTGAV